MLTSLDALAALPDDTLVHCAHEYTLSNIRFALACEPDNDALARWSDDAKALRAAGKPTLPTSIGHEKGGQSVPARGRAGDSGDAVFAIRHVRFGPTGIVSNNARLEG